MSEIDFGPWAKATGELSWGAQNVIHTALELAAEGKSNIVYGADYDGSGACLVNTVGQMLAVGGGSGIPSKHFGDMVSEFDRLNREFANRGINTETRRMSPMAAEILLHHFGELKPEPPMTNKQMEPNAKPGYEIYAEVDDAQLAEEWTMAVSQDAVSEDEIRELYDHDKALDEIEGPDYADANFNPAHYNTD